MHAATNESSMRDRWTTHAAAVQAAAGLHRPPPVRVKRVTGIQQQVAERKQHAGYSLTARNAHFARAARLGNQSRASGFSQQLAAPLQRAIV
jgi:hypothetical protein